MCVVSMVMDHYGPLFPQGTSPWDIFRPQPPANDPLVDGLALRKLIDEFKEAVAAAKKIDVLTKQPDCEDPEKVKLVARVAELEKLLDKAKGPTVADDSALPATGLSVTPVEMAMISSVIMSFVGACDPRPANEITAMAIHQVLGAEDAARYRRHKRVLFAVRHPVGNRWAT